MIRHIVLFELDGFDSEQHKNAQLSHIKEELEKLPSTIPMLHSLRGFLNQNPNEPTSFMLEALVENFADLGSYSAHPAHVAVVKELIAPFKVGRSAIDIIE